MDLELSTEDAPSRDELDRWYPITAGEVQPGMVVRDPVVGVWLLRPDGNSRLARVSTRRDQVTRDGKPLVVFTYMDIEDSWFHDVAVYEHEVALEVWR
jgi:hypothetical protein